MNEMECAEALGILITGTNGWDDAVAELYLSQLRDLDSAEALRRACESIVRGWTQIGRPPLEVILSSYDREVALAPDRRSLPASRVHCDGFGWVRSTINPEDVVPCPRCSPALAAVFAHPDKLERWKHGTSLDALDVGVELVGGRYRYRGGGKPPKCYPATDPDEQLPPPGEGRKIAWAAYSEEVRQSGRKPRRSHFDQLVRGGR